MHDRLHSVLVSAAVVSAAALGCFPVTAQAPAQDAAFLREDVFGVTAWRALGPANFGGRIVDLAVDPRRRSTFYVATGSGGLFKTENNGTTFRPVFEHEATVSIGDIAVAPSDGDVIYVGTGEANNQRSAYWGDGVYKSTDAGKSWQNVGLRGTDHIGRIVVHPTDKDTVYVAALGALYTPNRERGLYRTKDGGDTFACVKFIDEDTGFVDVVLDPQDPSVLYAASYERRRRAWHITGSGTGSAIWKSTDGGDSWQKLRGGLPGGAIGRIGLAISAESPQVLYALVENDNPRPPRAATEPARGDTADAAARGGRREGAADGDREAGDPDRREALGNEQGASGDGASGAAPREQDNRKKDADSWADTDLYPFGDGDETPAAPAAPRHLPIGGEVYRTEDGGETWQKTNADPVGGSPHYYYGQIRVDPNDDRTVYVIGVDVSVSTDGGKEWRKDFARGLHVDHHALWIDPKDSRHALLGNDGGLAQTWDGGRSWDYVNDLPIGQFYGVDVDLREPYTIYGGTQDNGSWGIPSRSTTNLGLGKANAFKINGGDGFYIRVDPSDPDVIYSESQFGAISRLDLATGARRSIRPRAVRGSPRLRFNWMSPIEISPHNPHTLWFGSQYLHRSRDRGDHWEQVSADLTGNDPDKIKGNVPHCTITTIAESPRQEGLLWVGTDDGRVWVSRNGGDRWVDLSDRFEGLPMPLWVSRVSASPSDADTAYVAFTGYREDIREPFLYLTTDGGESFRPIQNDLPRSPINVVREHPRNQDVLFVGHEFGVHVSVDGGASWHPLGKGLPTVAVHDLLVHPRVDDLVIGTHGRGLYVLDVAALGDMNADTLAQALHVFKPRDGFQTRRAFSSIRYAATGTWSPERAERQPVFRYYLREDSDEPVTLAVLDATGQELWSRRGDNTAGLHEVTWQARGGGRGQRRPTQAPQPRQQPGETEESGEQGGEEPPEPPVAAPPARGGERGQDPQRPAPRGAGRPQGPPEVQVQRARTAQQRGQGGGFGGRSTQAPGQYLLRVTHGRTTVEHVFSVRAAPGAAAAVPYGDDDRQDEPAAGAPTWIW